MHWLDVAKCLLIISVIVYHIPVFAEQNGVDGLGWMYNLRPLFRAYFMPAFFGSSVKCVDGYHVMHIVLM